MSKRMNENTKKNPFFFPSIHHQLTTIRIIACGMQYLSIYDEHATCCTVTMQWCPIPPTILPLPPHYIVYSSLSLFIFTCTYSSCGIMKRGCVLCAWAPDTLINTERTWRPTGPTKIILLFLYTAVQQTFILSKKWNFIMNELVQLQKKNT